MGNIILINFACIAGILLTDGIPTEYGTPLPGVLMHVLPGYYLTYGIPTEYGTPLPGV